MHRRGVATAHACFPNFPEIGNGRAATSRCSSVSNFWKVEIWKVRKVWTFYFFMRSRITLTHGIPPAFRSGVHKYYTVNHHRVSLEIIRSRVVAYAAAVDVSRSWRITHSFEAAHTEAIEVRRCLHLRS